MRAEQRPAVNTPPQAPAGNPNCLCRLIPAPGKHRQKGLWASEVAATAELGPDPSLTLRKVTRRRPRLLGEGGPCRLLPPSWQ